MNGIRLLIVVAIGFAASLAIPEYSLYNMRSESTTNTETYIIGSMPGIDKIIFNFEGENYTYTHTLNNGSATLKVDVESSVKTIHMHNIHLVVVHAKSFVETLYGTAFGNLGIDFKETIKIAGTVSDDKIKEMVRNHIIEQTITQITKL